MKALSGGLNVPFPIHGYFFQNMIRTALNFYGEVAGGQAYRNFPQFFQNNGSGVRGFHFLKAGDRTSARVKITRAAVLFFAWATGDWGKMHFDELFTANTRFKKPIAHGFLVGAFISGLLSGDLPGDGTVYESQTLHFKKPVYIGDEVEVTVEVLSVEEGRRRVVLSTKVEKIEEGKPPSIAIEGEAVVRVFD